MLWSELKHASVAEVIAWAEEQPFARAMAKCEQEEEWHAEGDVWTHTQMVLREVERLDEFESLTDDERRILIWTALLHDSAKPLTTVFDAAEGRLRSPKHAVKGEHLARGVLRDLGCDLATRERICRMVRFHGRPQFVLERDDPIAEVVRLSWLVDNGLLYLFALADTRGRDTASTDRAEETLHLFRMLAQEANCERQPFPFATDHARVTYFRSERPNLHYVPHEEFRCRVTLLSGPPGSGKDTWVETHAPETPVVSLDAIREELGIAPTGEQGTVIAAAMERAREHLRRGESFVFNATNLTRMVRGKWLDLCWDYGAHLSVVYIEPPLSLLLKQNKERERDVPEEVIHRLLAKTEPPTPLECHRVTLTESA